MSLDEKITSLESDVIYWNRRYVKRVDDYSRRKLKDTKRKLEHLKWKRENKS